MLVKDNVPRNIDTIRRNVKIFVSLVKRTVAQKHTLLRAKIKLMIIVRSKVRPESAPKNLKKGVVRCFIQKHLKRCFHVDGTTRKPVNEKTSCSKSITPIT
jgi:hypothetical protein